MITMRAYDADMRITNFTGLMRPTLNADVKTASSMKNLHIDKDSIEPSGKAVILVGELPNKIETLAYLYVRSESKGVLIAASGGKLYYRDGVAWELVTMPAGVTDFDSNDWSFVTYEINPGPVDVLVMTNAQDGLIYVRGDDMSAHVIVCPKKPARLARYAERIWAGGIPDEPDMLMYSAPFDPTDWEANAEYPEQGAGDILQPSWDGDSFKSLLPFGSQMLALKKNRIWRVFNTDPSEFVFKEQFGGGSAYPDTVVVDNEHVLMLSNQGLMVYDGAVAMPYKQDSCEDIWASMNLAKLDESCACMYRYKYYLAIPTGESLVNNVVVIYDTKTGQWTHRTDVSVEAFLPTDDTLYFTSAASPSSVFEWHDGSWGGTATSPVEWVGQWQDFGRKNIKKGGFELRFNLQAETAGALTFSVETEKKTKAKTYSFAAGEKQKRIRFGGSGYKFRLKLSASDNTVWRIVGGLHVIIEVDEE